jgi:hypothetical protein
MAAPKKKYQVTSLITISVVTVVEASSKREAKAIALQRDMQTLCVHCDDTRGIEEEWRASLDGEPDPSATQVTEYEDDS